MNDWEEDKIWEENEDTKRQSEVGEILPTIAQERGFETQGESAISDNYGRYGARAISQHIG